LMSLPSVPPGSVRRALRSVRWGCMPPISAATGGTLGAHFTLGVKIATPVTLTTYSMQEVQSIVKIADVVNTAKECPNLLDNAITLKCLWMHTVLLSIPPTQPLHCRRRHNHQLASAHTAETMTAGSADAVVE
jgi:hypothetical protein